MLGFNPCSSGCRSEAALFSAGWGVEEMFQSLFFWMSF